MYERLVCESVDWSVLRPSIDKLLHQKILDIENALPKFSLFQVRQAVPIYVDFTTNDCCDTAAYHPKGSLDWLTIHSEPLEKVSSINIYDAKKFYSLVADSGYYPASLLHEVAHAFHDRLLDQGFDNFRIRAAYNKAMGQGKYRHSNASKDHMEYFANNTTAFFMRNDAYPFTRVELSEYDPDVVALIQEYWVDGQS